MAGPGYLRRLTPLLFLLSGCAYAGARVRDLGDIVRLEGRIGYGLEAHANAGELAHAGLGSAYEKTGGWNYGLTTPRESVEHHLPLSLIQSFATPEGEHLHGSDFGDDGRHECYVLFPGAINPGGLEKVPSHYLDVEIGFLAGVIGLEAGVSLGETLDFLGGFVGWDFGDDDGERREDKRVWRRVNRHEGPSNP